MADDRPEKKARTTVSEGPNKPPELSFSLSRAWGPFLGILLPPLLVSMWCVIGWHDGGFHLRRPWTADHAKSLALVIGGGALAICAFWIVLPVAHFVREWSGQRFTQGNKAAWFLPLIVAVPLWMVLYLAFAGCVALGGHALFQGLLRLGVRELINS